MTTLTWKALVVAAMLGATPVAALSQGSSDAETAAPVAIPELDALETRTMNIAISGSAGIGSQIMGSSRMMAGRTAELSILDSQIASTLPIYGRPLGWERVGDRRIGTYLARRRYIVRHENMLTVWYVTYINLRSGWEVAGVTFNDQIQGLTDDW